MARSKRRALRRQRGLSAIEFALVFPIFFLLFYGLVHWGLILIVQESLDFAAQGAARAALTASPEDLEYDIYLDNVDKLARTEAGMTLAWMPQTWKDRVLVDDENSGVRVEVQTVDGIDRVRVVVEYPNYREQSLLPLFNVGGQPFPPVPLALTGEALLRL